MIRWGRLGEGQPFTAVSVHLGGIARDTAAVFERIDRCDLGVGELEVEDVEVLGHAVAVVRLREDDVALLQMPADDGLRPGLLVRCGDLTDDGVSVVDLALAERAPGLDLDVVLGQQRAGVDLLELRVAVDGPG
jgi:hypothetical protein